MKFFFRIIIVSSLLILFPVSSSFALSDFPVAKKSIQNKTSNDSTTSDLCQSFIKEISLQKKYQKWQDFTDFLRKPNVNEKTILVTTSPIFLSSNSATLLFALKYWTEGFTTIALSRVNKILKEDPRNGLALWLKGEILTTINPATPVDRYFTKAIKYQRFSPEMIWNYGQFLIKKKQPQKLVPWSKELLKMDPQNFTDILQRIPKKTTNQTVKTPSKKQFKEIPFTSPIPLTTLSKQSVSIGLSTDFGKPLFPSTLSFRCSGPCKISSPTKQLSIDENKVYQLDWLQTKEIITLNQQETNLTFPLTIEPTSGTLLLENINFGRGFGWDNSEARQYRGIIELKRGGNGFQIINHLNLEEYVSGVLPAEMPASSPMEALKAQAVAARSESMRKLRLKRHRNEGFDLCDDVHCQAYRGIKWENKRTIKAIEETAGLILQGDKKIIDAVYSSCCGGHTQSSADLIGWGTSKYLQRRSDGPKKVSPFSFLENGETEYCSHSGSQHRWIRIIPKKLFTIWCQNLKNIGEPIQLLPTKRNPSGHLSTLKIIGTKGEFELRRELEIRKKLFSGLFKSARFTILSVTGKNQDYLVFVGSGFGHGVGLCQEGACGMAKKGWPFEKILKFYYQDSIIKRIDF